MSQVKTEFLLKDKSSPSGLDDVDLVPLLITKLYRPPVTPELEQRQRLLEHLERRRQRPLTLISAPAGYGKTMLASLWLETCGCPSAWISLDEGDNDLNTFLSYLLAAISKAFPHIELKTQSWLHTPKPLKAPLLARYLLQDLNQLPTPFILVLDDIHRINAPDIFELLDELLQHPPPSLHLVMIGRQDPPLKIASLRAHSQVSEIRTQSLRFNTQETAGLLQRMLHREISEAIAAEWARSTEGWVTALRLAALSLRHRGQEEDLSLRIRGDSRYLRDYLLAEVLAQLPKDFQDWLIKSAILERFCAPLCEAVYQMDRGQSGMSGKSFIHWLEVENLFLIPLDDRHEWFRFHHLFQEMLLHMLSASSRAGEIADLRMRASHWCAENNLLDEALRYALAAGKTDAAVDLVVRNRYELMNAEQWNRLDRWISQLPGEIVLQNAPILLAKAYIAMVRGKVFEIATSARQAELALDRIPRESMEYKIIQSELAIPQSLLDNLAGQVIQSMTKAQNSLKLLSSSAWYPRVVASGAIILGHQMLGDFEQGMSIYRDLFHDPALPVGLRMQLMVTPWIACFQEGKLKEGLVIAQDALNFAEEFKYPTSISYARHNLGVMHYLRNEFTRAEPSLLALLEDRVTSAPTYLAMGAFALTLIYHAQNRMLESNRVMDVVSEHFVKSNNSMALALTKAFQVELALRRGKLAEAQLLSKNIDFELRPLAWFFYVPQLTAIKLLLAQGTTNGLEEARRRLELLDGQMAAVRRNSVRIDVLALLGLVLDALDDKPAALEKLQQALTLGKPGRFIRNFVDLGAPMANLLQRLKVQKIGGNHAAYIDQILASFPGVQIPRAAAAQALLAEPLTQREMEVLSLLARRLSNKEIATRLFISPRTVKNHTMNIYQKLEVNSRRQAVEKARALGILRMDASNPVQL